MKRILAASGLSLVGAWLLIQDYQARQWLDQYGSTLNPYQLKDAQGAATLQLVLGLALLVTAAILLIHRFAKKQSDVEAR